MKIKMTCLKKLPRRRITFLFAVLVAALLTGMACAETVNAPAVNVTQIENDHMTFAIGFQVNEVTAEQLSAYGSWPVDFEVRLNRDIVLKADGTADGYLSGQLDLVGSSWVNIPSKEYTLLANEALKTAEYTVKEKGLSSLVKLTFKNMYNVIQTFNCGVYLSPEYIEATPGLEVTVEARIYNPADPTQSIAISEPYVYTTGDNEATPTEEFTYSVLNDTYCSITGYKGTHSEIKVPGEIDGYIVQAISEYAFENCIALEAIDLPESLTSIGGSAFLNCSNLASIYIPKGVQTISKDAFSGCTGLTVYCYSGTAAHIMAESGNLAFELLDEHEHEYTVKVEAERTCMQDGYQTLTCSICGYAYIERLEALGHDEPQEFTVEVEATCTEAGRLVKACLRCGEILAEEMIPAAGHQYGEWTIEKEATLLYPGLRWCVCAACEGVLEDEIPQLELTDDLRSQYGMAAFRVVDAITLQPIEGAQLEIKLSDEEILPLETDANGQVTQLLPVGSLRASVYAPGKMSRSITIKVSSGECVIPDIGLSDTDMVQADMTVTEMTYEEIVAAGIDVNHPSNQHVYKYAVHLEFAASIDILNMFYYMNMDGSLLGGGLGGGGGSGGGDGGSGGSDDDDVSGYWRHTGTATTTGMPIVRYEKPGDETITVHPVSENFYLIIYGEVCWLKEMFDVEMLVINTSMTDTFEDCKATLILPEGLSLATMVGEQQTHTVDMGNLGHGEQKSTHWYVRGDVEGDYDVIATLTGVLQPFEEAVNQVYRAEEGIHVLAGKAMKLTYYVPDAAYYGRDYVVRAELENVSSKTLYNVGSLITGVEEGKVTHYSDGTMKETTYFNKEGLIAKNFAYKFYPGDKLVIELGIPIHFDSEIISTQLEGVADALDMLRKMQDAISLFDVASSAISDYGDFLDNAWNMVDAGKVADIGPKIQTINSGLKFAETVLSHPDEQQELFDIWEAMKDMLQTIPVRFDLVRSYVSVLEGSTTVIPTEIVVHHESGEPWAINLGKYLMNFIIAAFGEEAEVPDLGIWPVDFALENLIDVKEAIGYYDSIEYLKVVNQEVQRILAYTPGTEIGVRVWSEHGSLRIESIGSDSHFVDDQLILQGSSYIDVTTNGMTDTLYVDANGELKAFVFEPQEQHECVATWKVIFYATENTPGYEVATCKICHNVMDTRKTTACSEHQFSAYETDVEPTEDQLGVQTRICEHCHALEYRFINQDGALQSVVSFDANGGQGEMPVQVVAYGESYTMPECEFTYDTMAFVGWNTQADGSGESYAPGAQVWFADDQTFYAIWVYDGLLQYDMSGVRLSHTLLPYNGQEQSVALLGLPEGVSVVSITGLTGQEVGKYQVKAELATSNPQYSVPVLPDLSWSIERALRFEGENTKVYDGTAGLPGRFVSMVNETIKLSYSRRVKGDDGIIRVTDLAEAPSDIGEYTVAAEVTFGDIPYTETVVVQYEIMPRAIRIAPVSMVHEYDGNTVTNQKYTVDALAAGHKVVNAVIEGEAVLPGVYEDAFTIKDIIITDKNNRDVTANYLVTCEAADLEITKRIAIISVNHVSTVYDGKSHGGENYRVDNLLEGHSVIGVTLTGEGTDAGRYTNWLHAEGGQVVDEQGNDLMHLYQFQCIPGSMLIDVRPIWITANEVVHEYDGTLVENPGYETRNLAENQKVASLELTGGETLPGYYPAEFIPHNAVITDAEGNDVTSNYQVTYEVSDLTIEKRRITVTALDKVWEYDGTVVTNDQYTIDNLVESHEIASIVIAGEATLPGSYEELFKPQDVVIVENDTEVTNNYAITYVNGDLTIEKRKVTLTADDVTLVYDGTAHAGDTHTADRLLEGHTSSVLSWTGEATDAGTYVDLLLPAEGIILDAAGNDLMHLYELSYLPGTLTIEKRPVTITAADVVHEYDDRPRDNTLFTADNLVQNQTVARLVIDGSATLPGEYPALFAPDAAVIKNAADEDVTANYEIAYVNGSLTILPRKLVISSDDVTVLYDGNTHYADAVTADRLLEGHAIDSIEKGGGASRPGVYEAALTLSDAVLRDADGNDVTAYYDISYTFGTLTIEIIPVAEVNLSADVIHLPIGSTVRLVAEVFPMNASIPALAWESSNAAIVTVTPDGMVTRHQNGTVTMMAATTDGSGIVVSCEICDDDLPYMTVPAALSTVEEEAWMGNPALKAVDFSNTKDLTIGANAFSGCSGLVKVILPEGAVISEDAFVGCERVVLYCSDEASIEQAKEIGVQYVVSTTAEPSETPR